MVMSGFMFWNSADLNESGQLLHPAEAWLLDGEGGIRKIDDSEVYSWNTEYGPRWIHLDYTNASHSEWLRANPILDAIAADALLAEDTRPRVFNSSGGLIVNLRGVNSQPDAEPDELVSIRLFINKNQIISSRRRDLIALSNLSKDFSNEEGPTTTTEFLICLIEYLMDGMRDTADEIEDQIYQLEERLIEEFSGKTKFELAALRRQAIGLRRYLAPQREALSRLQTDKIPWLDGAFQIRIREANDRLIHIIEDLDAASERAAVTQEQLLGQLSEQLNKRMYTLSMMTVTFLPLTFITGLLVVNIGGIPGASHNAAFPFLCAALVFIGFLQILLFRWKNWF
jgi:zinc transporter